MRSENIDHPDGLAVEKVLKQDLFGRVELVRLPDSAGGGLATRRDTRCSRWWTRPLAHWLAAREVRGLAAADAVPDVPRVLSWHSGVLLRSWLPGEPMQNARPRHPEYFQRASRLVRRLHVAGIVHNDLAKEANWLVTANGRPALIDFQLAWAPRRRTRLFRSLGREDIRHLLKHKRYYCAEHLTGRERNILEQPGWLSRVWMSSGKPIYLFITRRIFKWRDRDGANDRHFD